MLARIVAACLIGSMFIFISAYESGPERIGYELTLSGTEPTQKIPEKCRCEAKWQKTTVSQPCKSVLTCDRAGIHGHCPFHSYVEYFTCSNPKCSGSAGPIFTSCKYPHQLGKCDEPNIPQALIRGRRTLSAPPRLQDGHWCTFDAPSI
ncbi:uncharacterized protein PGTG_22702 [Puccinia graminis f. sp. tritici CRL 75-36-700-3]|uniref:Uncharacterized protein n=1 Tax=Puccinia graminis f. sp. tritici (strain CRL 75-36-700-3 / race SCCL) TaxID=418459 RepID=H6QV90_PUCGT|nr:uncharacterized protein PGTG_22702 [Puccinia graminis f. sp. tritici CRL 75-36-700-3]EHS62791.1 hypothetical protein PGTG_22702 [Puccinia graminis f. sp. tritici CRL 75-36-700-3]